MFFYWLLWNKCFTKFQWNEFISHNWPGNGCTKKHVQDVEEEWFHSTNYLTTKQKRVTNVQCRRPLSLTHKTFGWKLQDAENFEERETDKSNSIANKELDQIEAKALLLEKA